jgi:fatty acid desaturase
MVFAKSLIDDSKTASGRFRAVEWPTVFLAIGLYSSYFALTFFYRHLPLPLVVLLGSLLIALHSSFQHELVHGHPTRSRLLNKVFALPPLSFWLPLEIYRRSHLLHHANASLTDPYDDPESHYWSPQQWQALGWLGRGLIMAQSSLLGLILIGPFWSVGRFFIQEGKAVFRDESDRRAIWLEHLLEVSLLVVWLSSVCHMSLTFYVVAFVYPGTAILMMRSFAEHRAADQVSERSAIVEAPLFGLLFLNNNLHAVHHRYPAIPWYELPGLYRRRKHQFLESNGNLFYQGYFQVIGNFLFRQHDAVLHPVLIDESREESEKLGLSRSRRAAVGRPNR